MKTKAFSALITGASLVAFLTIAGCDANEDREPYADQQTAPADGLVAGDTANPRSMDRSMDPAGTSEPRQPRDSMTRSGDGMTQPDGMSADGMSTLSGAAEAQVVGKAVLSTDGEEIGRVATVVADGNGESEFAVVEVGEFLGIGEKQVAIDVRHLRMTADGQIQSDVTADALQSMPEYEANDYDSAQEQE